MNYYFLKIGGSNCLAKQWLEGNGQGPVNPSEKPAVVVFFGRAYRDNHGVLQDANDLIQRQANQLRDFYNVCENPNNARVVVVAEKLWILKPQGEVTAQGLMNAEEVSGDDLKTWYGLEIEKRQSRRQDFFDACTQFRKNELPKYCEVKIEGEHELSEVPHILASMSGARSFNRPTICKISEDKYCGNYRALEYLCSKKPQQTKKENILKCLSPDELETLVAKIFEAYGCHVPAYSGKNMARVDLFAKNCSDKEISIPKTSNIPQIVIKARSSIGIQVKAKELNLPDIQCIQNPPVDYVVHLGNGQQPNNGQQQAIDLGRDWILAQLGKKPDVQQWLRNSLYWVDISKNFFDPQP